jgi:hypothetical protein
MAELKTKETTASVDAFLNTVPDEQKRKDCFTIAKLMKQVSKHDARMWGGSIVGFGSYHYKYASGHEGDACLMGFSPRKGNIVLYLMGGIINGGDLLKKLGKHKAGKGCLYINKLSDIDMDVLKKLMETSFNYMKETWLKKK